MERKVKVKGPKPIDVRQNFVEYEGRSITVYSRHKQMDPLVGELAEINDIFLIIQHSDGRRSRIRFSDVASIFENEGV